MNTPLQREVELAERGFHWQNYTEILVRGQTSWCDQESRRPLCEYSISIGSTSDLLP